jgi:P27 family predicted phage terminase small subunit
VQGNPSKRKLNRDEPKFSGAPECPDWLTASAKQEWTRVVTELAALDMLRSVDSSALAAYCQLYARWKQAKQQIDRDGQTVDEPVTNKAGDVVAHRTKRHPAISISKDALASMLRASALFGRVAPASAWVTLPLRTLSRRSYWGYGWR